MIFYTKIIHLVLLWNDGERGLNMIKESKIKRIEKDNNTIRKNNWLGMIEKEPRSKESLERFRRKPYTSAKTK